MKKLKVFALLNLTILLLFAASCSNETAVEAAVEEELPAAEVIVQEDTSDEAEPVQDLDTIELSSTQLIIGSFLLADTEYTITAEQALELTPLWTVYQSLLNSSTAAETEREALVNQIAGVFTVEQQHFLASSDTGQEAMQGIMTDLGIEAQGMAGGQRSGNGDGENTGRPEGGEEGVVGGRGGGGGQDGDMAGQDIDEEQQATMQAERAAQGGGVNGGGQMDTMLLPYLIEMLEVIS